MRSLARHGSETWKDVERCFIAGEGVAASAYSVAPVLQSHSSFALVGASLSSGGLQQGRDRRMSVLEVIAMVCSAGKITRSRVFQNAIQAMAADVR